MSDSPPAKVFDHLKTLTTKHRALLAKLGWLALILVALGHFKIDFAEVQSRVFIDGGYYTTVAIFVRDGLGLQTNVSLYHQAYSYFPHPTSVSRCGHFCTATRRGSGRCSMSRSGCRRSSTSRRSSARGAGAAA